MVNKALIQVFGHYFTEEERGALEAGADPATVLKAPDTKTTLHRTTTNEGHPWTISSSTGSLLRWTRGRLKLSH